MMDTPAAAGDRCLAASQAVKERFRRIGFSPDLAPCPPRPVRTPPWRHYFGVLLLEELILHQRSRHSLYFWTPDRDKFTRPVSPPVIPVCPHAAACPSLPPTCLQGLSELDIPHIPEMARAPEVNYLGCTCFLPADIFLLRSEQRAARSRSRPKKT